MITRSNRPSTKRSTNAETEDEGKWDEQFLMENCHDLQKQLRGGNGGNGKEPFLRWNGDSVAAKLLEAKLANGMIDTTDQPRDVYWKSPILRHYQLTSVRSFMNKCKAKMGLHVKRSGK